VRATVEQIRTARTPRAHASSPQKMLHECRDAVDHRRSSETLALAGRHRRPARRGAMTTSEPPPRKVGEHVDLGTGPALRGRGATARPPPRGSDVVVAGRRRPRTGLAQPVIRAYTSDAGIFPRFDYTSLYRQSSGPRPPSRSADTTGTIIFFLYGFEQKSAVREAQGRSRRHRRSLRSTPCCAAASNPE